MKKHLSRRDFLLTGIAATGMVGIRRAYAFDTRAESIRKYGGFKFGLQGHSLRKFPLENAVSTIQELELHWVEFSRSHVQNDATPGQIRELKKLLQAHDITCFAHGVNPFTADHEKNRRIFEFARQLGVPTLTANPSHDAFESLERLVDEFGIRIAIHNHGPGAEYSTIADLVRAVENRHPGIGICIDTGHLIRSASDPVRAVYELKKRVYGIHFKDYAEQKKETELVTLGTGHLDLVGMFRALREVGFPDDGALVLEYEGSPDDPVDEIKKCLEAASQAARKAAGRS